MGLEIRIDRDFDRAHGPVHEDHSLFYVSEDIYAQLMSAPDGYVDVTRVRLYDEIHRLYPRAEVLARRIDGRPVVEVPKLAVF
jgi:hypothetical protein